jgi:hypothetical protein
LGAFEVEDVAALAASCEALEGFGKFGISIKSIDQFRLTVDLYNAPFLLLRQLSHSR